MTANDMLRQAVSEKSPEKVAAALARGADPNLPYPPLSALHVVATTGPVEVMDELIRAKAEVNAGDADRNRTPLHSAVMSVAADADKMIDRLLAAGVHVNAKDTDGYTAFDVAIAANNRAAAKRLREVGGIGTKYPQSTIRKVLGDNTTKSHGRY